MLLFSSILDINPAMDRESFVKLVIKWNKQSKYENNIIPDLEWNGKYNVRYGNDNLWLSIQEYAPERILSVRYEKHEADGTVWDTDYVMNFNKMQMSIRLDRSYEADALTIGEKFSTPHFITLLEEKGYLKADGDLLVSREPFYITENNLSILSDIITNGNSYKLPVVFVSKLFSGDDPVDVKWLSSRLKGVAHVLVQESNDITNQIREACDSRNEFNGAIGIYFPSGSLRHKRFLSHTGEGYDDFLMEKVVKLVIQYCNAQLSEPLFTWQGVNNAILMDNFSKQRNDYLAADLAKKKAEQEMEQMLSSLDEEEKRIRTKAVEDAQADADKILASFDNELQHLQQQVEELAKANELLQYENQGLKSKLDTVSDIPVLYMGDEFEFYPGEIKDLVLLVLSESSQGIQEKTRRSDVIKDIIRNNDYKNTSSQKAEEIKKLLKGYDGMTSPLRQALEDMGFVITEDGKHYKLTYFGDDRYQIILSKTPSDFRTGKNSSQKLSKMVF